MEQQPLWHPHHPITLCGFHPGLAAGRGDMSSSRRRHGPLSQASLARQARVSPKARLSLAGPPPGPQAYTWGFAEAGRSLGAWQLLLTDPIDPSLPARPALPGKEGEGLRGSPSPAIHSNSPTWSSGGGGGGGLHGQL